MAIGGVDSTIAARAVASPGNQREDEDLQEVLTVEDVATLLKVSKSWSTNTRDPEGHRDPNVCPTSKLESTSALRLMP
jgi:hypothetical protein